MYIHPFTHCAVADFRISLPFFSSFFWRLAVYSFIHTLRNSRFSNLPSFFLVLFFLFFRLAVYPSIYTLRCSRFSNLPSFFFFSSLLFPTFQISCISIHLHTAKQPILESALFFSSFLLFLSFRLAVYPSIYTLHSSRFSNLPSFFPSFLFVFRLAVYPSIYTLGSSRFSNLPPTPPPFFSLHFSFSFSD